MLHKTKEVGGTKVIVTLGQDEQSRLEAKDFCSAIVKAASLDLPRLNEMGTHGFVTQRGIIYSITLSMPTVGSNIIVFL